MCFGLLVTPLYSVIICYFAIFTLSDATDVIKTILGMCNYRRFNRRIATKQQDYI